MRMRKPKNQAVSSTSSEDDEHEDKQNQAAAINAKTTTTDNNDDDLASTTTTTTATTGTSRSSNGRRKRKIKYSGRRKSLKPVPGYKFSASYTEDHKAVIYGVVFNHFLPAEQQPIFATVGSNRFSIYKCNDEGDIELLNCYADPDAEEAFYSCCWSYCRKTLQPLLIAAGQRGVIRIVNLTMPENLKSFVGHGGAINQLKVHSKEVHLLLSCSKDYSVRFWNLETQALIAIFGGVEGHRSEVLSIDFDLRGLRFVSGGMDHALKLWDISNSTFKQRIQLSAAYDVKRAVKQFPTLMQHYPNFSTREIHGNYVDCVQWFGDFIISKSCQDIIVIWRVGERRVNGKLRPELIAEFKCTNCELWFVRFDFNIWTHMLACGNEQGKVYVWELSQAGPQDARAYILTQKNCKTTERQVAFSKNAKVLVAVCDDGTIWRWNKI